MIKIIFILAISSHLNKNITICPYGSQLQKIINTFTIILINTICAYNNFYNSIIKKTAIRARIKKKKCCF
jgi:hypothetical protein